MPSASRSTLLRAIAHACLTALSSIRSASEVLIRVSSVETSVAGAPRETLRGAVICDGAMVLGFVGDEIGRVGFAV